MNIKTELQPDGYYRAFDADNYDYDSIVGYGKSEQEAKNDLIQSYIEASFAHVV